MKKIILEVSDEDTADLEEMIDKFNHLSVVLEDLADNVEQIKEIISGKNQKELPEDSP